MDGWDAVEEYKLSFASAYQAAAYCPGRLGLNDILRYCCSAGGLEAGGYDRPLVSSALSDTAEASNPVPVCITPTLQSPTETADPSSRQETPTSTTPKRGRVVIPEGEFPLADTSIIAFLCQISCSIPLVGFRALCLWIELRKIGSFPSAML